MPDFPRRIGRRLAFDSQTAMMLAFLVLSMKAYSQTGPFAWSVGAGAGNGYAPLGVQLEVEGNHWVFERKALLIGAGVGPNGPSLAFGPRLHFLPIDASFRPYVQALLGPLEALQGVPPSWRARKSDLGLSFMLGADQHVRPFGHWRVTYGAGFALVDVPVLKDAEARGADIPAIVPALHLGIKYAFSPRPQR